MSVVRLRDLRKRRGQYASNAFARREVERMLQLLPERGLERKIFLAIDVEGCPFKQVAFDLGITERHLYRLRTKMLAALEPAFTAVIVEPVSQTLATNQGVESAHRAYERGDAVRASALVRRALDGGLETPEAVTEALTLHVRAEADSGHETAARILLDELRTFASAHGGSSAFANTYVSVAEAHLRIRIGDYRTALKTLVVPQTPLAEQNPVALRRLVRTQLYAAALYQEEGSPLKALAILDDASAALARLSPQPAAEAAQLGFVRAFCLGADPSTLREARAAAEDATAISAWHGLTFEQAWSCVTTAWLCAGGGRLEEGLSYAREAADGAREVAAGDQLARILLISARLRGTSGEIAAALADIRLARKAAEHYPWIAAVAAGSEARVLANSANSRAAVSAATHCIQTYEGLNDSPYQGGPRYARAAALWHQGIRADGDIEAALHFFDRGGPVRDRIDAYELSAQMTKNRRHRRIAAELRAALA